MASTSDPALWILCRGSEAEAQHHLEVDVALSSYCREASLTHPRGRDHTWAVPVLTAHPFPCHSAFKWDWQEPSYNKVRRAGQKSSGLLLEKTIESRRTGKGGETCAWPLTVAGQPGVRCSSHSQQAQKIPDGYQHG